MSMTDTQWIDFENFPPEGQVNKEYISGLRPEKNLVTAVRELRRTTTGSYSAAVVDLLGAANDAEVATRAVNGQNIAPNNVSATGEVSGASGVFNGVGGVNSINARVAYATGGYTTDGLFDANARPAIFYTNGAGQTLIGYQDNGSGGYAPRIGFQQVYSLVAAPLTTSSNTSIGLMADGAFTINGGASNTERMRVSHAGNVGIGTTAPLVKTDIVGAAGPASDAGTPTGILRLATGADVTDNALMFGVHASDYAWISSVKPGTSFKDLVLQFGGGNVGIGTTAPAAKLHAVGDIKADGTLQCGGYTAATLPAVDAMRIAYVSDSSVAHVAANVGAIVVGGGSNFVPVYCDGANWRIG